MSDEIVFDVLCTKVLDALRALGLGKFSIRNYYYEGMWPIIKVYRSEGVIFYSAAFTNEIVNRFHLDHENGLVADRIWAKVRKASILFEEYVQTGKIVWKRVRPDPKISLAPYYHELLRRFCQHEANTRAIGFESLRDEENVCRKFFAYLDASGCHTCQDRVQLAPPVRKAGSWRSARSGRQNPAWPRKNLHHNNVRSSRRFCYSPRSK